MIIRPYEPRDREAIRQITCDTADAGAPVENFFPDREFIADVLTRYHTDIDPRFSWVAEENATVVGYLIGTPDAERAQRSVRWRIAPVALLRAVLRGTLANRQARHFFRAMWRTVAQGGEKSAPPRGYPAELHVNLRDSARGKQVGRALIEKFADQLRQSNVPGVVASVRADNTAARAFFMKLGFTQLSSSPMVLPMAAGWRCTESVLYGRKISSR